MSASSQPSSSSPAAKMDIHHRVLVLQGGGALGAYEAGVVKALCERLAKEDESKGRAGAPAFDIVAGASIGAVNAAILVSQVVNENNRIRQQGGSADMATCWKSAAEKLDKFWRDEVPTLSMMDLPLSQVGWNAWWNYWRVARQAWDDLWKQWLSQYGGEALEKARRSEPLIPWYFAWPDKFGPLASGEAARRYYEYSSATAVSGIPGVLTRSIAHPDMKFLTLTPFWRFDNSPLVKTLERGGWVNPEIRTGEGEPRLLLVCVDVQDCSTAVTFDSYPKGGAGDRRFSEYGGKDTPHVIEYDGGVTMNHILASMSTHLRYEYPHEKTADGQTRYLWDGAYLSNTPLREVLQYHREYWLGKYPEEEDDPHIPDIEVYIVNLYPSIEKELPVDPDSIQDREVDIKFHDRTKYDLKVAEMVTDYIDLARELQDLPKNSSLPAEARAVLAEEIKDIMKREATSRKRSNKPRYNRSLLRGRFRVARVVYVEREDDSDTIYGKAFDFTFTSISRLLEQGRKAAYAAYEQAIKEEKERAERLNLSKRQQQQRKRQEEEQQQRQQKKQQQLQQQLQQHPQQQKKINSKEQPK